MTVTMTVDPGSLTDALRTLGTHRTAREQARAKGAQTRQAQTDTEPIERDAERALASGLSSHRRGEWGADVMPGSSAIPNPAELLGSILDMAGSMRLEEFLAGWTEVSATEADADGTPVEVGQSDEPLPTVGALRQRLAERSEEIAAQVLRPIDQATRGRSKIPEASEVFAQLTASGVLLKRTPAGIKSSAKSLANPFHSLIGGAIDRARQLAAEARRELAGPISALGPAPARLVEVDLLITSLSAREVGKLFDRIPEALQPDFTEGLAKAVRALPAEAESAALAPWYEEGGWITAHAARCRTFVLAALAHEMRALAGLLDAVVELSLADPANEHNEHSEHNEDPSGTGATSVA